MQEIKCTRHARSMQPATYSSTFKLGFYLPNSNVKLVSRVRERLYLDVLSVFSFQRQSLPHVRDRLSLDVL